MEAAFTLTIAPSDVIGDVLASIIDVFGELILVTASRAVMPGRFPSVFFE
ncbi:MAG: hypothetical protein IPM66_21630 [Acidobacteriota bacterium]|nr:MAG: hypothetical protein IPM66_21630 [Acidobacteriota bacterium]